MAKITFSDPTDAQYLQTAGDNIYAQRTGPYSNRYGYSTYGYSVYATRTLKIIVRRKPKPPPSKTLPQSTVQKTFKDLTILWSDLTPQEKGTWQDYSTHLPLIDTAYRAFITNNSQLLRPQIPALSPLRSLSSPPQDPHQPTGASIHFQPVTSQYCLTWTHDYCADIYITAWNWIPPGRERASHQPFAYLDYAPSSDESLLVDVEFHDVSRRDQIQIRALNLRGEVSPFAEYIQAQKTAHRSGRYGYSTYGYSHYGA